MTVSFHKYGEYFPGTGDLRDIGIGKGKHYAVNFPLRDGIDDDSYASVFQPIIEHVMKWYQPGAVVLQCGADSLSGDRLGCFNLSHKGHAQCVEFVKKFNLPLLVLGGGGYTIRNVARAWTYETALLVNEKIADELPFCDYFEYFGPDYSIAVPPSNMPNLNSPEYLEKCKIKVLENLRSSQFAPSVQMQDVPPDMLSSSDDEDEWDWDVRGNEKERDWRTVPEEELSDSEDEGDRRDIHDFKKDLTADENLNEVEVKVEKDAPAEAMMDLDEINQSKIN